MGNFYKSLFFHSFIISRECPILGETKVIRFAMFQQQSEKRISALICKSFSWLDSEFFWKTIFAFRQYPVKNLKKDMITNLFLR